ncbi:MAG: hypothetical protein QXG67_01620, partial [Candidatus Nitrosotenuis sp.]
FVDTIHKIRKTLTGISISALVLAPFAAGMSIYLITHRQFYFVLEEYDEFGLFLSVLLGIVILTSAIWLILSIRQSSMLKSWDVKYTNYQKRKKEIDEEISNQFGSDENE